MHTKTPVEEGVGAGSGEGILRIGYVPSEPSVNAYTHRIQDILKTFGVVSAPPSLSHWLGRSCARFDVIVVNWLENAMVAANGRLRPLGILEALLRLAVWRIVSRKVILVRHNLWPHGTAPSAAPVVRKLADGLERLASGSWVHSGHLCTRRRHYIPHPLYQSLDAAPPPIPALEPGYFVIFGRILRYKRIEMLLAHLSPQVRLVILGVPDDETYVQELRQRASPNVTILASRLSDAAAARIVRDAQALVVCHPDAEMIVSGSALFALSLGVPVLALESGFTRWFQDNVNTRMLWSGRRVEDLAERMRSFVAEHGSSDVKQVQAHHSDAAIRARMAQSLREWGLL